MPSTAHPYMPNRNALRQQIKRVRRENTPSQPQSLEDLTIPDSLRTTIGGELFLIKDSTINDEKLLLFCTKNNVQRLSHARYLIMDGTFWTVPTIFRQLYTIHAPVGGDNFRVLPLAYALMSSKSETLYIRLFQDLIDFCEDNGGQLNPYWIMTDFEQAAIKASKAEFPNVKNKACFFHLSQSTWRKIQSSGLVNLYGTNEEFSLKIRQMLALAFIPSENIPAAFDELKATFPPEAEEVVQWFEDNYVHGRIRRRNQRNGNIIRTDPLFPPKLWSVSELMDHGIPRTQNIVEAWHRRWSTLVGKPHVGVYTMIEELQKEQQRVDLEIECINRGEPKPKQKKQIIDREKRIMTVYKDISNRSVLEFLRGLAHNISM